MKKYSLLVFLVLCMAVLPARTACAQDVAVKTNLLYDAAATVNLGLEIGLAPRWTLDVSGNYNGWTLPEGRKWKHWLVQPEGRFWFCDRFAGHFIAIHALGGQYNIGGTGTDFNLLDDLCPLRRYQGWLAGAGVAYGYAWILGRHWNLEAEIGFGYVYSRYDSYPCATCGTRIEENAPRHYLGPTKASVGIVYVF